MPTVADFIEQHREQIIERYVQEVPSFIESARGLRKNEVIDTLPEYLTTLAEISRRGYRVDPSKTKLRLEETHIALRLRIGFRQEEVLQEYGFVGQLISQLWEDRPAEERPTPEDVQLLFDELQGAMDTVVTTFTGYSLDERQEEKRILRRLEALGAELAADLPGTMPWRQRVEPLVQLIQAAMGADGAALLLVQRDREHLALAAATGRCAEGSLHGHVPLADGSVLARAANSAEPIYLPDVSTASPVDRDHLGATGLRSFLVLRLAPPGALIGVLSLGVAKVRQFHPKERRSFETLVEALGGIIQRTTLLADAQAANASLKERAEFERYLIGIVSHDLRNPLQAILLAAQALRLEEPLSEKGSRRLDRITSSAERMARMISDLLDFTRIRAGTVPVTPAPADLFAVLREVVDELLLANPKRQVELQTRGNANGSWDIGRITQVFSNLVSNALKYSPPESTVRITAEGDGDNVAVSVHNQGRAIPPEVLPVLFDPFKRGTTDDSSPGLSGGLGLGLYIVRQAVLAHHGAIDVHSSDEQGTTFIVVLPRHLSVEQGAPARAPGS